MPNPYHFIAHHPDVDFAREQHYLSVHRLSIAERDVAFFQQQVERWHVASKQTIRTALFDLMNSGISHRRYLKFIRSLEA